MEEVLSGGLIQPVVRVGDTVRRPMGPHNPFVHRLLAHLAGSGFEGAPRVLGVDEQNREILTFIAGESRTGGEEDESTLRAVMVLVRRFHDATAGAQSLTGGAEVVCHGDLSPRNTIYVKGLPVALIDWDEAAPRRRLADVAHACWQYLDFGYAGCDPNAFAPRLRLMCDAYGLDANDRGAIVDEMAEQQATTATGIEERAARGSSAYQRLVEVGAPDAVRSVRSWMLDQRAALGADL